jgi:hypothetical protein
VDWKKVEKQVRTEADQQGFNGRFGPGLPRVSDGSLLFLMHLISKMQQPGTDSTGSRIGIILNGSPLFTGGAGVVKVRSAVTFWKTICWMHLSHYQPICSTTRALPPMSGYCRITNPQSVKAKYC